MIKKGKISGVEIMEYPVIPDDRGSLHEFLNTQSSRFMELSDPDSAFPKNAYCSVTDPMVIKAFHYHEKQTDFFFALPGSAKTRIVLYDSENDILEDFYVGDDCPRLGIRIPCGIHHGWQNLSRTNRSYILNLSNRAYVYDDPDEIRADPNTLVPSHHGFSWGVINR